MKKAFTHLTQQTTREWVQQFQKKDFRSPSSATALIYFTVMAPDTWRSRNELT